MKSTIVLAVIVGCAVAAVSAQSRSSTFARGSGLQSWQNAGLKSVLAKCKNPAPPFSIPGGPAASANPSPPPEPPIPPATTAIPGVIAAGQNWKVVWSWEGNNADGIIAGEGDAMLFANNDASNVMRLDPATGLATIVHRDTNTGGALSRNKNGALFLASRGLNGGILQLEPQRKVFASSFRGEPLECVGGVLNDLVADGSLTNQREFGKLRGGEAGDGSAVDAEGRLYVATGSSVDVFAANGQFLGSIPGPQGLHGTAFGGRDKKTLFGIVFYGAWGTASARNRVIAIPVLAQGYPDRAK